MARLRDAAPLLLAVALVCLNGCSKKEPASDATKESTITQPATTPAAGPAPPEPAPASAEGAAASESAAAPSAATAEAPPAPAAAAVEAPPPVPEPAPAAPAAAQATATAAKPADGAQIAQGVCMACHQAGMNGAPKFGNKVAWAPRIAQGRDKLYEHAIKGLRGMPPKGGSSTLTDDQVKAAVDYMVKVAGGYQE